MLTRRRLTRPLLLALVAAISLAVAPTALAGKTAGSGGKGGKPSSGGTGTISLVLVNSTDGLAHYGQTVTFNIATTATTQPWVHLRCYQGGTMIAEGWNGYFEGSLTGRNFGLYSPQWTGGAADCTADLTNPQWSVLGTTSFHVYA